MKKKIVESPVKKFVVEKGGNPRGKGVSKEEVKQALRDIGEWFKVHAKDYYAGLLAHIGAKDEELKTLQDVLKMPLPLSVQALLSTFNGGLQLLDTYLTLSLGDIATGTAALSKTAKWKATLIPIAQNAEGEFLCVDSTGGNETAIVVWTEKDGVTELLSPTFGAYLESIRDSLLLKKLEYDETLGLVAIVDAKK